MAAERSKTIWCCFCFVNVTNATCVLATLSLCSCIVSFFITASHDAPKSAKGFEYLVTFLWTAASALALTAIGCKIRRALLPYLIVNIIFTVYLTVYVPSYVILYLLMKNSTDIQFSEHDHYFLRETRYIRNFVGLPICLWSTIVVWRCYRTFGRDASEELDPL
ncbi:hypothetical protein QR680_016792 [Steinernema hermaphroditum]|uniref:Uncharacterized protein n=1 Tax=Steinernema hermaphroditum TaxID=289476 RepID=A0AA39HCB1_9BILA|nr:hypothetical protein QR680_016792 [Steinernema hermaphroditum]